MFSGRSTYETFVAQKMYFPRDSVLDLLVYVADAMPRSAQTVWFEATWRIWHNALQDRCKHCRPMDETAKQEIRANDGSLS